MRISLIMLFVISLFISGALAVAYIESHNTQIVIPLLVWFAVLVLTILNMLLERK